jgi:hypothetical protein
MSSVKQQTVLDRIRTRGYWRVVIRPTSFDEHHVPTGTDLFPIVEKNSVRLRGWDYPHVDRRSDPLRGPNWVGQECDWDDELEVWRFYRSGQFLHFFAVGGDWRDRSRVWPPEAEWEPGKYMYYLQSLYSFVEIFEFASRLAYSPAGAAFMHVRIEIKGLKGRHIVEPDNAFRFSRDYITDSPEWNYGWRGSQTDLIAQPRELAAVAAQDLFACFGLNLSPTVAKSVQARIGR